MLVVRRGAGRCICCRLQRAHVFRNDVRQFRQHRGKIHDKLERYQLDENRWVINSINEFHEEYKIKTLHFIKKILIKIKNQSISIEIKISRIKFLIQYPKIKPIMEKLRRNCSRVITTVWVERSVTM